MGIKVSIVHQVHGHLVDVRKEGQFYRDDNARVDYDNLRPCAKCGLCFGKDDHDPCIANLPGTENACCAHGLVESDTRFRPWGYVNLADGRRIEFRDDAGGERIRSAVEAALAGRDLPQGFYYADHVAVKRVI